MVKCPFNSLSQYQPQIKTAHSYTQVVLGNRVTVRFQGDISCFPIAITGEIMVNQCAVQNTGFPLQLRDRGSGRCLGSEKLTLYFLHNTSKYRSHRRTHRVPKQVCQSRLRVERISSGQAALPLTCSTALEETEPLGLAARLSYWPASLSATL